MTVFDLLKLLKRHIKLMIVVPIVCAVLAFAWSMLIQASYSATASFVTNGDLALAQGLANNVAASYSNNTTKVTCSSVSSSKTIVVTAIGDNPYSCVDTANNVANETVKQYKEASSSIIAAVSEAGFATSNNPSLIKMAFVALLGGLLLAICFVLLVDWFKAPVKSREDIESSFTLPILGSAPSAEGGEEILANLQFSHGGKPSTVAVIPVGTPSAAPVVARELGGAFERSDIRVKLVKGSPAAKKFKVAVPEDAAVIVSCEPLKEGMGAAYIAHNADATILCVSEWTDSKKQIAAVIKEMKLAKVNIAGFAYLPEEQKPKHSREE